MKVKKYLAPNSRESLRKVRADLGPEAVILSSRQTSVGFEVLALAKNDMADLIASGRAAASAPQTEFRPAAFVSPAAAPRPVHSAPAAMHHVKPANLAALHGRKPAAMRTPVRPAATAETLLANPLPPREEPRAERIEAPEADHGGLLEELRALRGMVEEQAASMAWMHGAQARPLRATLLRELLAAGFGAAIARKIVAAVPDDFSAERSRDWIAQTLTRNLSCTAPAADPFERGGVFALVGPTGVGKTTTVAKLAARCVVRHGAQALGLVSADHYRIGAQDQLRIYGHILNVPVHAAHDADSLRSVITMLAGKKLILIDTVGVGQRDARVAEQTVALEASGAERVLLVSAAGQSETLEETSQAYRGKGLAGAILTKLDEAALLGGCLDVLIRSRLQLSHVTNGQRVPEDLHPAQAAFLVHQALKQSHNRAFRLAEAECGLLAFGDTDKRKPVQGQPRAAR